ncbi:hypothetical protein M0811_00061 [Anaeramoeba ignava]|uniref:Uncharacterized protein n=1 Tax=Anaeramoeba ignava TaxID=1746090 RepID=A0A9Q0LQK1_ANAIG|nr:hypothetical protein M0811_00061 [Anaeramoeba ignava]
MGFIESKPKIVLIHNENQNQIQNQIQLENQNQNQNQEIQSEIKKFNKFLIKQANKQIGLISEIVKPILKFFYNGKFEFDKQKFDEYFQFANEIKLKEIKIKIELEIQSIFTIENILEIYFKISKN